MVEEAGGAWPAYPLILDFRLQSCERINFCCFQPPCLWGWSRWPQEMDPLTRVAGLVAGGEGRGCGGREWEGGGHCGFLRGPGDGTSCWFEWGTWDHMTHSFHIC